MTLSAVISESLEKIDQARYAAGAVLLAEALADHDWKEIEKYWPLLFGLIQTLLLSGQSDAMKAVLLKLNVAGEAKKLDVRMISQLAAFHSLLDSDVERLILDDTLRELQVLDRQHGGRYRAGVLVADGMLAAQCGDVSRAVASLQRAWAHSQTRGGFCPQQMACEILRLSLASGDTQLCDSWNTVVRELNSTPVCCRTRAAVIQAELAIVGKGDWDTEKTRQLLGWLDQIECPDLVVRGCAAVVRLLTAEGSLDSTERSEFEAAALKMARRVGPSRRVSFDKTLLEVDVRLCAEARCLGLVPGFAYTRVGIKPVLSGLRCPAEASSDVAGGGGELSDLLADALRYGRKLDRAFDGAGFEHLVRVREEFLQGLLVHGVSRC